MDERAPVTMLGPDEEDVSETVRWAGAFLAGFKSVLTRRAYRRDLECWFVFCNAHQVHPFRRVRRTHLELYLRELEAQDTPPAPGTLYRRVATLSSWFRWLEDEDVTVGNPAARIRRPQRHGRPQSWLNRNEFTDLITAAEDDGGDAYALVCLLGLNGLRVSEACNVDITDLGGSGTSPPCESSARATSPPKWSSTPAPSRPSTRPSPTAPPGRCCATSGRRRMQPHNAAALLRRLAATAGITQRVTPHALSRSYLTIGLLQGVPLRDMQRAARHAKADTTVAYDQSERSFHKDPTFVLMAATAR